MPKPDLMADARATLEFAIRSAIHPIEPLTPMKMDRVVRAVTRNVTAPHLAWAVRTLTDAAFAEAARPDPVPAAEVGR